MQEVINERERFYKLSFGIWCAIPVGCTYAFGILATPMRETFHISQTQLTDISTAAFTFAMFSLPAGFLFDWVGPRYVTALATVMVSVGFILMALAFEGLVPHTVPFLAMANILPAWGCGFFDVGTLMTNLYNFPLNRGEVVILQKTFMGLGSAMFSTYYVVYFKGHYASYCFFVAAYVLLFGILGAIWVTLPKYALIERYDRRRAQKETNGEEEEEEGSSSLLSPGVSLHTFRPPTRISATRLSLSATEAEGTSPSASPHAKYSSEERKQASLYLQIPSDKSRFHLGFKLLAGTMIFLLGAALLGALVDPMPMALRMTLGVACFLVMLSFGVLPFYSRRQPQQAAALSLDERAKLLGDQSKAERESRTEYMRQRISNLSESNGSPSTDNRHTSNNKDASSGACFQNLSNLSNNAPKSPSSTIENKNNTSNLCDDDIKNNNNAEIDYNNDSPIRAFPNPSAIPSVPHGLPSGSLASLTSPTKPQQEEQEVLEHTTNSGNNMTTTSVVGKIEEEGKTTTATSLVTPSSRPTSRRLPDHNTVLTPRPASSLHHFYHQNQNSFCINLLGLDLWLLLFQTLSVWGAGIVITVNASQIYRAANHNHYDSVVNSLYISLIGLGSAVGRIGVGIIEQKWTKQEKSVTGLMPLPPFFMCIAVICFLTFPPGGLFFPFFFYSFAYGMSWSVFVLSMRLMHAVDVGKHYNFLFMGGMVGVIVFNRFLFGVEYDQVGHQQKLYPGCSGVSCFLMTMSVLLGCNFVAIGAGFWAHRRWLKNYFYSCYVPPV